MEEFAYLQLKSLNEQRQFKSAELLGSFIIKSNASLPTLLEYANAIFGCEEWLRASVRLASVQVSYTNLIEQVEKSHLKGLTPQQLALAKYNCSKCYHKQRRSDVAIQMLKTIPNEYHTVESLMLWAKITTEHENKRSAAPIYKEILKRSPFCIEAAIALYEVGTPSVEVVPKQNQFDWIPEVYEAIRTTAKPDLSNPSPIAEPIMNRLGDNPHVILAAASSYLRQGDLKMALAQYNMIRAIDRRFVTDMDGLAWVLFKLGDTANIIQLSIDLMKAAPTRHEAWGTAAVFYSMNGNQVQAQECLMKATTLGSTSPYAWLIRGELSVQSTHAMAISFRTSWVLMRSFPAAEGLVNALFMREEYAKALIVANDVLKVAGPNSPSALTLHGRVQMKDPKTRDLACKDLEKAIQLDENHIPAIVTLAEWHRLKKDFQKAEQLLEKHIARKPHELLYVALGETQMLQDKFTHATHSFNLALGINRNCAAARVGITKVEEMIRATQGGDDEEEDEDEDDDDEDDDDEADA